MDPDSFALMVISAVIIVLIGIGGPVWLGAQFIKSRSARRLSTADVALIEKIAEIADRMDRRMAAVEQILDSDTPAWRRNDAATGGQYERKLG